MKIFSTSQILELDALTIANEPIASIDLMERAAVALSEKYLTTFDFLRPVCILAGPGNNGGDALAMGRLLSDAGLTVQVHLLDQGRLSADCQTNASQMVQTYPDRLFRHSNQFKIPEIIKDMVIIDGLFGSGLNRQPDGMYAEAIRFINQSRCKVVAIDIPSGLHGEKTANPQDTIVRATLTFNLQFPKLAFMFPENESFVGEWSLLDIGIHPKAILQTDTIFSYFTAEDAGLLIKRRSKFSHKGSFGHCFIIAGSRNMAGAAMLSGKAALRSGVGLVTVSSPESNRTILQTSVPEALFAPNGDNYFSEVPHLNDSHTMAIGPGLGTSPVTLPALEATLKQLNKPCVLDADALNLIAQRSDLISFIPPYSILTPHPKEFERLFGASGSSPEHLEKARKKAQEHKMIIVLKGANTLIAHPDGQCIFNSSGNSGMATAGSGDVLTGIIVGLLAQGYSPLDAACLGVYLHGLSGDLALENESSESLIAGDLIKNIGSAYKKILSVHPH